VEAGSSLETTIHSCPLRFIFRTDGSAASVLSCFGRCVGAGSVRADLVTLPPNSTGNGVTSHSSPVRQSPVRRYPSHTWLPLTSPVGRRILRVTGTFCLGGLSCLHRASGCRGGVWAFSHVCTVPLGAGGVSGRSLMSAPCLWVQGRCLGGLSCPHRASGCRGGVWAVAVG
jgi:hypothetical protein